MKAVAIKALWAPGLVALFVSTAAAEVSDELAALMVDGLNQYAEVSGKADSCGFGRQERIDELADRIAAWRYPGWWDGLWGTRTDYADQLRTTANLKYSVTVLQPCPGLSSLYEGLADTIARQIEDRTEPEK